MNLSFKFQVSSFKKSFKKKKIDLCIWRAPIDYYLAVEEQQQEEQRVQTDIGYQTRFLGWQPPPFWVDLPSVWDFGSGSRNQIWFLWHMFLK